MTNKGITDAVVVTYRRPEELQRLVESLRRGALIPRQVIIVDNSPDAEARALCQNYPGFCRHLPMGRNAGVGAGLNAGLRALHREPPEFVCALDDDCIVGYQSLASLVAVLQQKPETSFTAPLVSDSSKQPATRPGFMRSLDKKTFKESGSWQDLQRLGDSPLRWATGVCLVYRYRIAIKTGLYREDCWVLGEDVEFTLRISHRSPGCLVATEVAHVPPNKPVKTINRAAISYTKFLALLTNMSFFTTRLAHARRELPSVPKIFGKFLLTAPGISGRLKFADAIRAVWIGAVKGQPAGGELFKRSFKTPLIPDF